jgi:hypothetical protein
MSSYQYPDAPVRHNDRERILSVGPIDVKTHCSEISEDIIERFRTCLEYRDPRAAGDIHRLRPAPRPTLPDN